MALSYRRLMMWILPCLLFVSGLGPQAIAKAQKPQCCAPTAVEENCACPQCRVKCECKISAKPAKEAPPAAVSTQIRTVAAIQPIVLFVPILPVRVLRVYGERQDFVAACNGPPPDLGRAPPCL